MKTRSAAAMLSLGALLALGSTLEGQVVAYTDATVWDGTGAPSAVGVTVLVEDGMIRDIGPNLAVPASARTVSLEGRFVVPGFVNTHGHVSGRWAGGATDGEEARIREDLLLYARYGVTTVNSLGDGTAALVVAQSPMQGRTHARLLASGPVVTEREPASARARARANVEGGASWLKLRVDDNLGASEPMPWDAVEAVFDVGRETDVPVATHLFYLEDARRLVEMGTGLVAHSVRDTDVDAAFVSALAASRACYVPTLTREVSTFVYGERPDFFDDPFFRRFASAEEVARLEDPSTRTRFREDPTAAAYRRALDQAMENLATLQESGIPIAFGTDSGPAARFPGYFEHMELSLMVDAGLTPSEALQSATGIAADCLGLDHVGTLEAGRAADFLVLRADPTQDISATRTLERVFVAGVEVPMS
ncbi:MAG: amidohydrolase family protein [Gemmatimonadota bacterium]